MFVKTAFLLEALNCFFVLGHPEVHHGEPQRGPWEGQHLREGGSQVSGFNSADNWCDINCFSLSPDNKKVPVMNVWVFQWAPPVPRVSRQIYYILSPRQYLDLDLNRIPRSLVSLRRLIWFCLSKSFPYSYWPTWYSTYHVSSKDLL